jgi:FKBP-type peptidyl-prolyl cis-trans isomerase FkpA
VRRGIGLRDWGAAIPNPLSLDSDLRIEDAALATLGTTARFRELLFTEREAARAASGRNDDDTVSCGAGGANHVSQRVLDVGARQSKLACQSRHRPRLVRETGEEVATKGHEGLTPRVQAEYTLAMTRVIAVIILAATMCACGSDSPTSPTLPPTSSGAYTQTDLVVGAGAAAANGNTVTVAYTGWLYDTSKPNGKGNQFDASASFAFQLGAGRVIRGWDQGVLGMRVGGQRRLLIPPELAYGSSSPDPTRIPNNATLLFDITLTAVQ